MSRESFKSSLCTDGGDLGESEKLIQEIMGEIPGIKREKK